LLPFRNRIPRQRKIMPCVIGSGPVGVACARALLARGANVLMLDAGLDLEPERAQGHCHQPQQERHPDRGAVALEPVNHAVQILILRLHVADFETLLYGFNLLCSDSQPRERNFARHQAC
jgi:NAD(P)-dependent dehydrogenase (short-subunit alcohol dehydrogenase family)